MATVNPDWTGLPHEMVAMVMEAMSILDQLLHAGAVCFSWYGWAAGSPPPTRPPTSTSTTRSPACSSRSRPSQRSTISRASWKSKGASCTVSRRTRTLTTRRHGPVLGGEAALVLVLQGGHVLKSLQGGGIASSCSCIGRMERYHSLLR
ncbi:unnamed protein product [Urochloa humidicola]